MRSTAASIAKAARVATQTTLADQATDRAAKAALKRPSPVVFVPTAPAIVEFTGHPPKVGPPSALLTFAAANAGRNAFRKEAGPRATRAGALACMYSRAFCYGRKALI